VLRRARRLLILQIALGVSAVVLLVGSVAYCAMVSGQHHDVRRELHYTMKYGDREAPPGCAWLFERRGGEDLAPPHPPARLPVDADLDAAERTGRTVTSSHELNGTTYLVRTARRHGAVRQVAFDQRYQLADRRSLLAALLTAEALGVAAAVLIGGVLSRRAVRPLQEALARQRRFVADASHELRTPLTRLHVRAQLVARQLAAAEAESGRPAPAERPEQGAGAGRPENGAGPSGGGAGPEKRAGRVEQAEREARQLARDASGTGDVLDDLLLSARLDAGSQPADPVDLAGVVSEVLAAETARAERLGLTLELRASGAAGSGGSPAAPSSNGSSSKGLPSSNGSSSPGGPAGASGCTVYGAETALRRAVGALVDNAIGHSTQGGTVRVTLRRERRERGGPFGRLPRGGRRGPRRGPRDGWVVLEVADDGVGLQQGPDEAIFERFARGSAGHGRRFGLGLALVREVMERHGGTVSAAGAPGSGAVFTVRLPAAAPPLRAAAAGSGHGRGTRPVPSASLPGGADQGQLPGDQRPLAHGPARSRSSAAGVPEQRP